ncbi:MAG: FAD-binding oxidoreductase [Chloroflexota bacterium]
MQSAELLICGAGIGGISAAYSLATKHNITDVLLVDPEPPLSVTSDKSFEAYRNWWPGPGDAMVALANHSINILERIHCQQPDLLHMNRRGYLFVSADPSRADELLASAQECCNLGAGEFRVYRGQPGDPQYIPISDHGLLDAPDGADLILDRSLIRTHFPHLADNACILLHTRRCGWFAARQFGMYMLDEARARGVRLLKGEVVGVEIADNAVSAVRVKSSDGETVIQAKRFVNAAGPGQKKVGALLGLDLPVHAELHMKMAIDDQKRTIPREMPLTIWYDPIHLEWSEDERAFLAEDESMSWLLDEQPAVAVARPEGVGDSTIALMQWHYHLQPDEPIFPLPVDPDFPEYVLRGVAHMLPTTKIYFENLPKPYVDGGYYMTTPENRPIIGPTGGIKGAYMLGGLSGFGMQIGPAAGELLADYVADAPLPDYAPAFLLERFDDPGYLKMLEEWGATGNL